MREASAHGVEVMAAVCDLAIPAEITTAIARVRSAWEGVHILVIALASPASARFIWYSDS
jgi:NAD(P)-dependent dehydrogenase (short-subunit alcohol dehydrogenase family)